MSAKGSRGLVFGSIALILLGVILLLNNFLLITNFNITALLPLVLVLVGMIILLRGDFVVSKATKAFGITRGSVESGILEISAGAIDVSISAMEREGRLIAGQYAYDSRPQLAVDGTEAHLRFDRAATPWLSFSDWKMEIARDLPWSVYASASLGNLSLDCSGLIISKVKLGTGIGSIRFVCPQEAFEPLYLRSTLGNIRVLTPVGVRVRIIAKGAKSFGVRVDDTRYERLEDGSYISREANLENAEIELQVNGTFGDLYLA